MSIVPEKAIRSTSPVSSEASTRRGPRRFKSPDESLRKDKSYRRYAAGVERALGLFDTALQEWADYIAFLGRLLKALQAHPEGLHAVPDKRTVAKRLAQCLDPSLPSGVHQKTLELYDFIFTLIEQDGLARDLTLYLPGIAPTLTFASLKVRPSFLALIEEHVLRLPASALRPALKAIILSLLPGLEEERDKEFDRTLNILNSFKELFSQEDAIGFFWQSLFLASITSPSRRPGVLAYLSRYLPKLGQREKRTISVTSGATEGPLGIFEETVAALTKPEPGLLVRCFATGLFDEQSLVQRSFLDMLVTHLPLDADIYQHTMTMEDQDLLVTSAMGVVLRRDMSLNRRLWSWFLGPENLEAPNGDVTPASPEGTKKHASASSHNFVESDRSAYFAKYALKPLLRSMNRMIDRKSLIPLERARPFRIALSLMDKWEVGGPVVADVFLPLLRSVEDFERTSKSREEFDEVFRSANVFFDGVESSLIWSEILRLVDISDVGGPGNFETVMSNLEIARFIVSNFNIREEEMLLIHIPLISLALLCQVKMIETHKSQAIRSADDEDSVLEKAMVLLKLIVNVIPDRALALGSPAKVPSKRKSPQGNSSIFIFSAIKAFYEKTQEGVELPPLPFSKAELGYLMLRESAAMVSSQTDTNKHGKRLIYHTHILTTLIPKIPSYDALIDSQFAMVILRRLTPVPDLDTTRKMPFAVVSSLSSVLSLLSLQDTGVSVVSHDQLCDAIPLLITYLWAFLSASTPQHHVESVRHIWHLHAVSWQYRLVESTLTFLMAGQHLGREKYVPSRASTERLTVIWNHSFTAGFTPSEAVPEVAKASPISRPDFPFDPSARVSSMLDRPVLFALDALADSGSDSYAASKEWLQSMTSLIAIFQAVLTPLRSTSPFHSAIEKDAALAEIGECCAYLQRLSDIISVQSNEQWRRFATNCLQIGESGFISAESEGDGVERGQTLHFYVARLCVQILDQGISRSSITMGGVNLQLVALSLIRNLLNGPFAELLIELKMHNHFIRSLDQEMSSEDLDLQLALLETLSADFRVKVLRSKSLVSNTALKSQHHRGISKETLNTKSRMSLATEKIAMDRQQLEPNLIPSADLLPCLLKGISSPKNRRILDKWVLLLCETFPLLSASIFQILINVVECFCKQVSHCFDEIRSLFTSDNVQGEGNLEKCVFHLLSGLEFVLAQAHERLIDDETILVSAKSPEQAQGFFGNIVAATVSVEDNQMRNTIANNRLTVILCFQDTMKICVQIWAWKNITPPGPTNKLASFQHTSLKMRNRSRRVMEHLLEAEALECIETLIEIWTKTVDCDAETTSTPILDLLQTLDAARPRIVIPALFNAIYSRTNPAALDSHQKSTLSSNLSELEVVAFLVEYSSSLEDDVLDEIWTDCTIFLRDILANPMPHRQILSRLLVFITVLGAKMENTNFGEQRKMRRELSDLFVRLLTAILTIKPSGTGQDISARVEIDGNETFAETTTKSRLGTSDIVEILCQTLPTFGHILGESDRLVGVVTSVSLSITGPLIRSRLFPRNVSSGALRLVQEISKAPNATKAWKKDVIDALNDSRIFQSSLDLARHGWLGLIRQLSLTDKNLMAEFLARLTPPATAGLMFGVGANAARLEADKKAQLNLRRIATLILATENDTFLGSFAPLQAKLEELLTATRVSSPSSVVRAEVFMLLRALILKTSPTHLGSFWPTISSELHDTFSSILEGNTEAQNGYSILQAAKLLDVLLLIKADEFQLHEWLFVTDTVDAIYRPDPDRWQPTALIDEMAESLQDSTTASTPSTIQHHAHSTSSSNAAEDQPQRPWLCTEVTRTTVQDAILGKVLRPFFGQLSIHAYEGTYRLGVVDMVACTDDVLADIFHEEAMVS